MHLSRHEVITWKPYVQGTGKCILMDCASLKAFSIKSKDIPFTFYYIAIVAAHS